MKAFAISQAAIFLLRAACLAVVALMLTGCFMSRQPLITAQNAEFPFATGTVLKPYELSYDNGTPQFRDTGEPLITLEIDDGYYTDRKNTWIRLHKIQDSPNYLIMLKASGDFAYALVEQVHSSFILHIVTADHFAEYKKYMKENDPYVWRSFFRDLQELPEGKVIQFASLESATTVLPHMVSRGFSSASSAYKIIDKRSSERLARERDAGRRGSNQDNAAAQPELTPNAQRVQAILKNMNGNRFAYSEDGGDVLSFAISDIQYLVRHDASKAEAERCSFLQGFRNDRSFYVDFGCDGSADEIVRQPGGISTDLTPEEHRKFGELLARVTVLSKLTRQYKSITPQGQVLILPDVNVINRNAQLLQKVFDVAKIMKPPNERGMVIIQMLGGREINGTSTIAGRAVKNRTRVDLLFSAKIHESKVRSCFLLEDLALNFTDADCDGRFELFAKTAGGRPRKSAFGNDKVVNAMLEDLARFTDFAAKYHLH